MGAWGCLVGAPRSLVGPRSAHILPPPAPSPSPRAQEIKAKINALQQSVMKIGASLAGQQGGGDGGSAGGSGENVQDAEVKDKKE